MKISVVIPAYNEEDHIRSCLEHLKKQSEKADEIIVVDNNSTDNTAKIAEHYGAFVIKEKKQGMISARNAGFNRAKYEVIARTDADTFVPKNWIKTIKENFTKNKNLAGLSGTTHFYDFPVYSKLQHSQWQNKIIFAFIKSQIKHATLYGPNMAIRKNAWDKIRQEVCLDEDAVHEDTDLAIHLGQHGDIKIDPRIVVATSFRRWKKPYTYFEYSHRLLKTFRRHRSKNTNTSQNTNTYHNDVGLIDVLWKEFKSSHNTSEDTAILYIPGWSLNPSSKPVEKLCQKLAGALCIRAYAIQTKPKNIMNNSLFYEAEALKKLLPQIQPRIKQAILITHSQGTIKTIHLADMLQDAASPEIKGIIFITTVGLYNLSKQELLVKFFGEIMKAFYGAIKEILMLKKHKAATDLILAVIFCIKNEITTQTLTLYMKRLGQQLGELTSANSAIIGKLQKIKTSVNFILAEKDLVSSSQRVRDTLKKSKLQRLRIIEAKETNHTMPYTQIDALTRRIENLVSIFFRSESGRKTKKNRIRPD
ncbi:MAG: glycosyltransferase [Patescibacteria group bacterium]